MANELKAFIENLSEEEREELKWLLKTLERKSKQENNFYFKNNVCPSCGARMDEIDGIYQCEKCGYTHVEGY